MAIVNAEVGVGIGGFVDTGKLDQGTGIACSTASDLDLHAGHVVLWLVDVGAVDT